MVSDMTLTPTLTPGLKRHTYSTDLIETCAICAQAKAHGKKLIKLKKH